MILSRQGRVQAASTATRRACISVNNSPPPLRTPVSTQQWVGVTARVQRLQPYVRQSAFLKVTTRHQRPFCTPRHCVCVYARHIIKPLALSAGPGRDRDTKVRERDGSGTQTGGSGTGAGELLAGTGGSGMA